MAQTLGMVTTAEGVETEEQLTCFEHPAPKRLRDIR
jgi:sensor c-di-GMP phosphodiesterase-like protein